MLSKDVSSINESKLKIVFVVPYRDRKEHKHFFEKYMEYILEDYDPESYIVIFSEQKNNNPFNRGATKNLGFLYIKKKFPKLYSRLTFVFNDVDNVPFKKNLLDYQTKRGIVKHFYGYNFSLGGIVSVNGSDFNMMNGFPNYWGWGFEDTMLYRRAIKYNLKINRDTFFPVLSHSIIHFSDNSTNNTVFKKQQNEIKKKETDGLNTLRNINQEWDENNHILNNITFDCSYLINDDFFTNDVLNGLKVNNKKANKNQLRFFK